MELVLCPVVVAQRAESELSVEGDDDPGTGSGTGHGGAVQWTILDSGSSIRSVAPASFSAGIRMLISFLGTTVSTA